MTHDTPWRDTPQGAGYLQISERHLRYLVARGEIAAYRRGRLLRFHVDDLDAWLRAGAIDGSASAA